MSLYPTTLSQKCQALSPKHDTFWEDRGDDIGVTACAAGAPFQSSPATPDTAILHSAFCIFHSAFAPHHWSIIKKVKVPVATSFPSALDSSTWITDRVCPSFLGVATQVI